VGLNSSFNFRGGVRVHPLCAGPEAASEEKIISGALDSVRGGPPADAGTDRDGGRPLRLPGAGAGVRRVRDDQVDKVLLAVWERGADQPAVRGQRALPEVRRGADVSGAHRAVSFIGPRTTTAGARRLSCASNVGAGDARR
jgi:hypothetical protein